jgi:hypothetical protein
MLDAALEHAIQFLIAPIQAHYLPTTIERLRRTLTNELQYHYQPTWVINDSSCGSGRRALSLAPGVAPRPIHNACLKSGVEWPHWISALGAVVRAPEFDFFVDPGHISIRCGNSGYKTIWSHFNEMTTRPALKPVKTFAQQMLEADADDAEELFAQIEKFSPVEEDVRTPNWLTTTISAFPHVPRFSRRAGSPTDSIASRHSRTSSFSSASSASGASFSSVDSDSFSRRGRQSPVFVDATKTEVTPYDGGKTTVLTGGVMLGGGAPTRKASPPRPSLPTMWRRI